MGTDKPKFSVIVDQDILDKIEEFRYVHKLRSKSAAAAELIKIGLATIKKEDSKSE